MAMAAAFPFAPGTRCRKAKEAVLTFAPETLALLEPGAVS
jgi:hypothetical protein